MTQRALLSQEILAEDTESYESRHEREIQEEVVATDSPNFLTDNKHSYVAFLRAHMVANHPLDSLYQW